MAVVRKANRAEYRYQNKPRQQSTQKKFKLEPVEGFKLSPELKKIERAYQQRDKILR